MGGPGSSTNKPKLMLSGGHGAVPSVGYAEVTWWAPTILQSRGDFLTQAVSHVLEKGIVPQPPRVLKRKHVARNQPYL